MLIGVEPVSASVGEEVSILEVWLASVEPVSGLASEEVSTLGVYCLILNLDVCRLV